MLLIYKVQIQECFITMQVVMPNQAGSCAPVATMMMAHTALTMYSALVILPLSNRRDMLTATSAAKASVRALY